MMRGLQLYPTKADGLSQADGSCELLTQPIVETPSAESRVGSLSRAQKAVSPA